MRFHWTGFTELKVSVHIELRASSPELGGRLFQGNVFVDDEAICDDQWGGAEAGVVCK